MSVRDWGVAASHFTFDTQIGDKLGVLITSPYFNMDTMRLYITGKRAVWNSINGNINMSDERKQLRNDAFSGEKVEDSYTSNRKTRKI